MSTATESGGHTSTFSGTKTLRLHVWGASSTIPTLDPTSLYAASLLYSTFSHNPQVQIQLVSATTSLPRVPLLQVIDQDNLTTEVLSSVEGIRSFCNESDLDRSISKDVELSAKCSALHALLDDQLLDLTLHSLFSLPANYRSTTAPAYSSIGPLSPASSSSTLAKLASLPLRFQPSIPSRLRNAVETRLTAVGLWGLGGKEASAHTGEADDLAARAGIVPTKKRGLGATQKEAVRQEFEKSKLTRSAGEVLEVIEAALQLQGERRLLGGGEVASLDAKVFGYLAPLVFAEPRLPVDTLPRLVNSQYPRLAEHLREVKEKLYPDRAVNWITQSEALKTPPTLAGTTTEGAAGSGLWSYIWPFAGTTNVDEASKASFTSTSIDDTSQPQYQPSSSTSNSPRNKSTPPPSTEDKRLRLGRALWICSAVIGLVGYTFASGIPPQQQLATHDPSTSCALPSSTLTQPTTSAEICPRRRTIVSGTFNSPNLYVLTYDILSPNPLSITQELPGLGPHQYLSLGLSSGSPGEYGKTVYATTWAEPSTLSAWHFCPSTSTLSFGNSVEITAAGSYVHTQPPPYYSLSAPGFGSQPGIARWLGSAGGPTGELHKLDPETGRIGERVKEIIFLPGGEEQLKSADKSRRALRYGAHSFDCSSNVAAAVESEGGVGVGGGGGSETKGEGKGDVVASEQVAFVADLGANAVQAYSFPSLSHLYSIPSAEEGDGPRHAIPHPTLPLVFTVTEHTNFVDAYQIPPASTPSSSSTGSLQARVKHIARADMLTIEQAGKRGQYRGDTLRFSSDLKYIYATTRGKTSATKGLLLAFRLTSKVQRRELKVELNEVARFETRTSGGKANAIELAPSQAQRGVEVDTMVLTDDEEGFIDVITFDLDKELFSVQATTQLPKLKADQSQGASHAIWLN